MGDFRKVIPDTMHLATIVAFDPGGTTGYCVMGVHPAWLEGGWQGFDSEWAGIEYIDYGQIDCDPPGMAGMGIGKHDGLTLPGENQGVDAMMAIVYNFQKPAVVLEDFILDFSKADMARHTLSPVRITSAFAYSMHIDLGLESTFIQSRSLAKSTCTDDRLKNWGLYDRYSGNHARDAARHAFYFLRTCRGNGNKEQEKRWRAWPHLFQDPVGELNRKRSQREKKPAARIEYL